MFADSHCHLNDSQLLSDLDEVLSSSSAAGVSFFLVVGWDFESSLKAIELTKKDGVYAAIGFHPCNIEGFNDSSIEKLKEVAKHKKVLAIGEIGLDYHWVQDKEEREHQREVFVKQIQLANQLELPISIHARDAVGDTLAILKENPPLYGGVMHCYSGSKEAMMEFLKLGFYIGFDGPVTYKNAASVKENAKVCPIDRILLETDSPYLPPIPHRGETNYPKYIPLIAEEIANLKGISVKELEERTLENFENAFHVKL